MGADLEGNPVGGDTSIWVYLPHARSHLLLTMGILAHFLLNIVALSNATAWCQSPPMTIGAAQEEVSKTMHQTVPLRLPYTTLGMTWGWRGQEYVQPSEQVLALQPQESFAAA